MQETETPEVFHKFYGYPDRDELPCNRDELKKEPAFAQFHFFYHTPGIVKRNKCFPSFNTCFLKHAIDTNMPADRGNNKNYPTNTHK